MRKCQSVLAIILAIAFISCQSAPQPPVPISKAPVPYPSGSTGVPPQELKTPQPPGVEGKTVELEPAKGQTDTSKPKKKESPIKPVISQVQSGLLSPSTQEIPVGAPAPPQKEKQRIVFNFEKADIAEVSNQIFGDQLKLNYVLDQTLQGRVSMYIEGDFDNNELLQMVTRAYEANGISIVPKKGFYFIQASQKTTGSGLAIATPSLLQGDKESRPLIVIYRLRYMDPKQASTLIAPFMSPGKKVTAEPLTNSLIFVEETDNARSLVNLLKTIDINILQEISMEIVPLNSIAPQDAVQGMESLMGKLGGFKDSAIKNSLAFIPLQNFGGVLVMAQSPELLKSARQWIQALDIQGVGSTEEIHVYFVQNGLARDIGDILNQVFGISGGGGTRRMEQQVVPSGRTATRSAFGGTGGTGGGFGGGGFGGGGFGGGGFGGSSFGRSSSSTGTGGISGSSYSGTSGRTAGTTGTTGGAIGSTAARTGPGGKQAPSIFTGEVMIIPDEVNNALVIRANAVDYGKIKKTIESLDILPRAVLIEVLIAEVALTKDFKYGLQYFFQAQTNPNSGFGVSFGGLSNVSTSTATTTTGTSGAAAIAGGFPDIGALAGSGIALSWIANAQNLAVFLNALAARTTVNVLSSPTLLATDNKDATITVGGRTPVPTGSFTGGGVTDVATTSVFSTIQYEETGVILNVTPHINAGGLVRLELEQTIRRVGADATVGAGNTAPTFTERNVKTTLLAQSGSTVVIGGIIDSAQSSGKSGIPYLQDVPLLSPLFAARTAHLDRTELIVAITPHVIDQRGSEAPRELLQKLNSLKRRAGQ